MGVYSYYSKGITRKGTEATSVRIPLAKASVGTMLTLEEAKIGNSTIFLKGGALMHWWVALDIPTLPYLFRSPMTTSWYLRGFPSQPLLQSICLTRPVFSHCSSFLWLSSNLTGGILTHIGQHLWSLVPPVHHSSNILFVAEFYCWFGGQSREVTTQGSKRPQTVECILWVICYFYWLNCCVSGAQNRVWHRTGAQ